MPDTPYSHTGRVRSAFERTNRIDCGKRCVEMRHAPYGLEMDISRWISWPSMDYAGRARDRRPALAAAVHRMLSLVVSPGLLSQETTGSDQTCFPKVLANRDFDQK